MYGWHEEDENGIRTIVRDNKPLPFSRCVILYLSLGKNMWFLPQDEEGYWRTSTVFAIE